MKKYTIDNFSVMSVQYVQYSFEYYLKSMKKCGFNHIDFWGGEPHYSNQNSNYDLERLKSIKSLIDKYEMNVVVYTPETLAYPYSYSHPDKKVRSNAINYMKRAVDDAKVLNAKNVFINSGCGLRDLDRELSFEHFISSVKEIIEYASKKDITIVLEQLQPYESNLVITLNDIKRVINSVNSDYLKVCIDVVAMEVAKENLSMYFDSLGKEKIGLIHFSDYYHYILGEGDPIKLPLNDYLDTLARYDYDGYIDLEINDSIYWLEPHKSIQKSKLWLEENL